MAWASPPNRTRVVIVRDTNLFIPLPPIALSSSSTQLRFAVGWQPVPMANLAAELSLFTDGDRIRLQDDASGVPRSAYDVRTITSVRMLAQLRF